MSVHGSISKFIDHFRLKKWCYGNQQSVCRAPRQTPLLDTFIVEGRKIVFLPDACADRSPLPTGTVVLTRQTDWRRFAISDCGCGVRSLSSNVLPDDDILRCNKGDLGDLGDGNHFLDALEEYDEGPIHSRSRSYLGPSAVNCSIG